MLHIRYKARWFLPKKGPAKPSPIYLFLENHGFLRPGRLVFHLLYGRESVTSVEPSGAIQGGG